MKTLIRPLTLAVLFFSAICGLFAGDISRSRTGNPVISIVISALVLIVVYYIIRYFLKKAGYTIE
jgi:hypothetical protein